ncbi:MAG: hypothetical protein V4489_04855 [Chlamydiota bacterium]
MGVSLEEDQKRKIIELALQSARKRLSPQTGYIHLYAEDPYNVRQDTVPSVENFSYVYALFRSKLVENIQEGKNLLDKLLKFEVEGNYPVYLHQFPTCEDTQLSSLLLPYFFYLTKEFEVALGGVLMGQIEALIARIVKCLEAKPELSKASFNRLSAFLGKCDLSLWHPENPTAWGEWCICAQMIDYPIEEALSCFDAKHFVFTGKTKDRLQEGLEPAVTLLDLFMGEYFQDFSARSSLLHPIHLRASLVHPFLTKGVKTKNTPFVAIIEEDKRQCLTLYWGDKSHTHSLVVEAKKGSWKVDQKGAHTFNLEYTPEEAFSTEEESVECALYVSAHKDVHLAINDLQATAFHEGDKLSVTSFLGKVGIRFFSENGNWIGHISKANRSFQRRTEGYSAHDWKIGWRTLRRTKGAKVNIAVTFSSSEALN